MKKGLFFVEKKSQKQQIVVSKLSVLGGIIPKFTEGYGCCNWMSELLYCQCGKKLGIMDLDCHQPEYIKFNEKYVRRNYK